MQIQSMETNNIQDEKPSGYFHTKLGLIAYWIKGKGENLILLHSAGPGHEHRDFDAIIPKLSESYRVISLDWPGHGKSEFPNPLESASAVSYAEILPDLIKQLAPGGAILIGNSLGGFASIKLAVEKPDLVKGLILVDTGGMNDPDFKTRTFVKLMSNLWFTGVTWNAFPNYYLKVENRYTKSLLDRVKEKENIEGSKQIRTSLWKSFSDEGHDMRERVSGITVPTLIVWGEKDPVILPEFGEKLSQKIKGSQLVFLQTGHVPFAEDPETFLKITIPFLKSIR